MEFNFTKSQLETLQKLVEYPDDFKYPLGTIIASDDIHAVDNIGGQWDQIEDRFLLGAGSTFAVGSIGGEINHQLTEGEMPSHKHLISLFTLHNVTNEPRYGPYVQGNKAYSWTENPSTNTNSTGGNLPHNNMPPYMAKYMWIKTKLQSELEGENV